MQLLVTGGAGFIGSNFIRYWLQTHPDDTIRNFDALTYAGNAGSLADLVSDSRYVLIKGDITDAAAVERAMAGVDIVVHLAAESHVDRSVLEPAAFVRTMCSAPKCCSMQRERPRSNVSIMSQRTKCSVVWS